MSAPVENERGHENNEDPDCRKDRIHVAIFVLVSVQFIVLDTISSDAGTLHHMIAVTSPTTYNI
jgi:hypothetical protein